MAPLNEGLDIVPVPFQQAFNIPIRKIAHPPVHPQLLGLLLGGIAKEDPLNESICTWALTCSIPLLRIYPPEVLSTRGEGGLCSFFL